MTIDLLQQLFPKLKEKKYSITSSDDVCYNCIAWVAHDTSQQWWPRSGYYWPREPIYESVNEFIEVFGRMGYKECNDGNYEEGYEKIAIYVLDNVVTHMARQLDRDTWTSKIGDYEDILHNLNGLDGSEYGIEKYFMKRNNDT